MKRNRSSEAHLNLHADGRPPDNSAGFTLAELVVTVSIMAVLAAVAIPQFSGLTNRTQAQRNISNIHVVREAFMKYYFRQHMRGNPHFPDPPRANNNLMSEAWANSPIPSNPIETPGSLFSEGKVPLNSNGFAFYYDVTVSIDTMGVPIPTMILKDVDPDSPTYGVEFSFSL